MARRQTNPQAQPQALLDSVAKARQALRKNPQSGESYLALAAGLQALGETAAAAQALDRALELDPHLGRAWYRKGLLVARDHKYRAAAEDFQRALEGGYAPARRELGEMLLRSGDFNKAAEQLEIVVRLDPKELRPGFNPEARFRSRDQCLAAALSRTGERQRAAKEFAEAQRPARRSVQLHRAQGGYNRGLGTAGRAAARPQPAQPDSGRVPPTAPLTPGDGDHDLYRSRGIAYTLPAKFAEALADYNRAIRLAPQEAANYIAPGRDIASPRPGTGHIG